jgi:predicted molibdopterin-dependent oxidoreductase YjgC
MARAAGILAAAGKDARLAVVYAPNPASEDVASEMTKAAANLAIHMRGDAAAESLLVLPVETNTYGVRDMGAAPGQGGLGLDAMLRGGVKALLVVGDNPMMHARGRSEVEAGLRGLETLVVIDSLQTDTVALANVAFADLTSLAKAGTHTSADRRLVRLSRAEAATGDQRDCLAVLSDLAAALGRRLGRQIQPASEAPAVLREVASTLPGYEAARGRVRSGVTRALPGVPSRAVIQPVNAMPPAAPNGRLLLTTGRTLYTNRDAAALHSPEADKLHREEFLELNPADASALGIGQNRPVIVGNGSHEVALSAALTDAVQAGSAFLPLYYDGGLVNVFLSAGGAAATVSVRPA